MAWIRVGFLYPISSMDSVTELCPALPLLRKCNTGGGGDDDKDEEDDDNYDNYEKNDKYYTPPLSKVRLGENKMRSERGVCLGQGRALDKGGVIMIIMNIMIFTLKIFVIMSRY